MQNFWFLISDMYKVSRSSWGRLRVRLYSELHHSKRNFDVTQLLGKVIVLDPIVGELAYH